MDALTTTLCRSIEALGRGFDVTADIRLLYCKGTPGSRLVHLNDTHTRDLLLSDGLVVPNVPDDVQCSSESRVTENVPVCSFHKITVGRKPVTGLRLNLEGSKQNRLAIHLQHLVSLPKILQTHCDSHVAIGALKWHGPEEQDSRWFEPIKWKNFSHVSTAPIEYTEANIGDLSGVHIVTGAQLGVWDFGAKNVLYLKPLFSKVPGCTIRQSVWDHSPSTPATPMRSDGASSSSKTRTSQDNKKEDSSANAGKLAKVVDLTEMSKGPQDIPGHWLVTGAKLGVDKGRIVLRIKYLLLNY
ncbi:MACPF domain-containing protein CAD1-like [Cucurbita moschata]|uniref:MACPF domain-containing protein CAD1-like n=1 Tax=Cucurbita moschata TaxID=3662 RepID=A0A6J1ECV2_CUCMO|nr:MACPF domain-containing protein CAD1-like [Cucurbita moschata]